MVSPTITFLSENLNEDLRNFLKFDLCIIVSNSKWILLLWYAVLFFFYIEELQQWPVLYIAWTVQLNLLMLWYILVDFYSLSVILSWRVLFLVHWTSLTALNPLEPIGSYGARNFVLCKKQVHPPKTQAQSERMAQKGSGGWKAWLNKSFSFKILSH